MPPCLSLTTPGGQTRRVLLVLSRLFPTHVLCCAIGILPVLFVACSLMTARCICRAQLARKCNMAGAHAGDS